MGRMAERKVVDNFSTLNIRVTLTRHISQFVVDYYIPSSMLVCMSWVSFWLEPSAIPGRTTLGTASWLTFITLNMLLLLVLLLLFLPLELLLG